MTGRSTSRLMSCWRRRLTKWIRRLERWCRSWSLQRKRRRKICWRFKIYKNNWRKWWLFNRKKRLVLWIQGSIIIIFKHRESLILSKVKKALQAKKATKATSVNQKQDCRHTLPSQLEITLTQRSKPRNDHQFTTVTLNPPKLVVQTILVHLLIVRYQSRSET